MASNNSVMSRVQMFEKQTASSDVGTPVVPKKFGRQGFGSDPTKKSKPMVNSTQKYSYTPPVKQTSDAGTVRPFTVSPKPTQANNEVAWPSPDVDESNSLLSNGLLPSQIKSFQGKKASPHSSTGQKFTPVSSSRRGVLGSQTAGQQVGGASPSSDVLESRNPKSTVEQSTPVQSNLRKEQEESPHSHEVQKLKSPVVGWPSPDDTSDTFRKAPQDPPGSNPAASFSQDENEAPKATSAAVVSSAKESTTLATPVQAAARTRVNLLPHSRGSRSMDSRSSGSHSDTALKRNLNDASMVIQDERESSIGSTSSSHRSSLSVDELSNIAMRALRASRQNDPPKSVTAKLKNTKSVRRRRAQYQRSLTQPSAQAEEKKPITKPESDAEEVSEVAPKTKSQSRIAVLAAAQGKTRARSPAFPQAKDGPTAGSDARLGSARQKKSRYDLFETARQRAGSRSPSPVMMASSASSDGEKATTTDEQTDSQSEKELNSKLAILSAGRRKISTSSYIPVDLIAVRKGGAPSHRRQPSTDTNGSDSISTQETTLARRDRRTARMAVLAAAHRQSPILRTANESGAESKAPSYIKHKAISSTKSSAKSDDHPVAQASEKRLTSRLLELSSTGRSPSPLLMQTKGKNALSKDKGADVPSRPGAMTVEKPVAKAAISTETPLSSRKEALLKAASSAHSKPVMTKTSPSPDRKGKSNLSAEFLKEQSPTGSAFSSPGAFRVSEHPAVIAKMNASPARSGHSKSSRTGSKTSPSKPSPSGSRHSDVYNPVARSVKKPVVIDDSWQNEIPRHDDAASDISSSHGGVKAAIDAWSSKSKETKGANVGSSGRRARRPNEEQPVRHREAKPSDLYLMLSPRDDVNAMSSETSVGASNASTFVSSPSSYASSKMSVGAPGSFFRPMAPVNDFEEAKNDPIMLGQLSADTDEDSSALPSHLFKSTSEEDRSRSGDTELSYLLELMESENSASGDSGTRLFAADKPASQEANGNDNTDQSTLIGQYHVKSSSEDNSSTTPHRTYDNEHSTLFGQSLLDSEVRSAMPHPIAESDEHALTDSSKSKDSADSQVIKWWQNTDPFKRRQKFEPRSEPTSNWPVPSRSAWGASTKRRENDDLFSGLSGDDASRKSESHQFSVDSFGDDVFSGVTPSADSSDVHKSEKSNSSAERRARKPTVPPPPPPPPLEPSSSHQFGTILVHGSHAVDSVGSDITSSVLGGDFTKDPVDWRRHEATAVIKEELTAEIEDEEETLTEGEVLSDRKQKEAAAQAGKPLGTNDSAPREQEGSLCSGVRLNHVNGDTDEADHDSIEETENVKGDSIFMSLGKFMDSFAICGAPEQSLYDDHTEFDGTESHAIMSGGRSIAQSTLNEHELKIWDEWERQNSSELSDQMDTTRASTTYTVEVMQRRENAHRKLLQYAEKAQSAASSDETDAIYSKGDTAGATTSKKSTEAVETSSKPSETISEDTAIRQTSNSLTLSQRRILEKFSSTLKHQGLEVLKLNRDKKWQARYLTVSKEVLWLDSGATDGQSGDRGQCPLGILWSKRFSSAKEYSITTIDRQGRGGMLFDQLVKVSASGRSDLGQPLTKKQNDKFKEAVNVTLEYSINGAEKAVILRCRTTDAAHFLCTGLRVIVDLLQKESSATVEHQDL